MPLSDHEQRLLSEMEQRLLADDPRFASTMRGSHGGAPSRKRLAVGILGVAAGLAVMLLALNAGQVIVAVLGFVLMLGGASWALTPVKRPANGDNAPGTSGPQGVVGQDGNVRRPRNRNRERNQGGSFMQKMERRWERRQDGDRDR